MIPFLDVRGAYLELKSEIDDAVHRVLESGNYILGPEVEAFESDWAAFCEARYAVGVGNGLDALTLALRALEIGPGDEVIVPSNTFIATWLAVSAVGAVPVPVEPDARTYNIDPNRIAEAITPRTRAIIPVHLYGQPAELDSVLAVAKEFNLRVIEDAAQAQGARYQGRRIGGHGDVVCWSFFPGKNLGAVGDAGAITTDSAELADRVRLLRNYGSRVKYANEVMGVNSRLDPLQAAILGVKLRHLDEWNSRRRTVAALYSEALADTDLVLPQVADGVEPVWHLYVIRTGNRDRLQQELQDAGITTLIHYPTPPHRQPAYADSPAASLSLPFTTTMANEILSLPVGPQLSVDDAKRVSAAVKGALV